MTDHGQGHRTFAASLVLSTAGAGLLLALDAPGAWVVAYVAVVQLLSRLVDPYGAGLSKVVLGLRVLRAMRRGEIVLHYQPKVSLATDELVGVEALARWQHRRSGLLAPALWLAGTELRWTEWRFLRHTLDAAVAQAKEWGDAGLDILVCLNVTPRCFADRRLPDVLAAALRREGVSPTRLQLELTETALDISPAAVDVAERLTALGVSLALDDFGVGHSSMERLARLPINELKIDRRFVGRQTSSPRAAAIVRASVDLGHALGLAVTAEGVESRTDAGSLRRAGCDIAQGFQYAAALPPDELQRWHRDRLLAADVVAERQRLPDRRLWDRRERAQAV